MTLSEFLYGLSDKSPKNFVLGSMYYQKHYQDSNQETSGTIKSLLKLARIPKSQTWNIADILGKAGGLVDSPSIEKGRRQWKLTSQGEHFIRDLVGLETKLVERDVIRLEKLVTKTTDTNVKDYLQEALICLRAEAHRACVVFLWAGAVTKIRDVTFAKGRANVNASVQKFQANARVIKSSDDLAYLQESTLLLVAQDLGLFDKNQKDALTNYCLDVRNKSGHPGKYRPGPEKAAAVMEDLIQIVFNNSAI